MRIRRFSSSQKEGIGHGVLQEGLVRLPKVIDAMTNSAGMITSAGPGRDHREILDQEPFFLTEYSGTFIFYIFYFI